MKSESEKNKIEYEFEGEGENERQKMKMKSTLLVRFYSLLCAVIACKVSFGGFKRFDIQSLKSER